jgi:hypothetical protein
VVVSHLHSNQQRLTAHEGALDAFDITYDGRLSAGRK